MQRSVVLLLLTVCCLSQARAQDHDSAATARFTAVGFELDALPFLTGGYYASIWYGVDHLRLRGVITRTTVPQFVLPDGFKENKLRVAAVIADYFKEEQFQGWWIGAGVEFWNASIGHDKESSTASYSNFMATVGGGYVWKFSGNFYLNPWGAVHLLAAGDREVAVGSQTYKPSVLTGEVSLKLGFHL